MKFLVTTVLLLALHTPVFGQTIPKIINKKAFTIGEVVQMHSAVLNENRTLNIYLPLGYSPDSAKTYPVIYLLDGSRDEDFIHIAGLVQFNSFSWIGTLPESIVVGIGNVDRRRDFTFPSNNALDKKDFPTSGQSASFIRFLETELQPFIQANYHTQPSNMLIGQSLGGLLATEVLFKKPELFDRYVIVSPSLWWDDESMLDTNPITPQSLKNVFIAVGREGEVMERTARELYEKLLAQGHDNLILFFEFLEDRDHGDALHEAVDHAFLKFSNQ